GSVTDTAGHDHMPLPGVLNAVADVYAAHSIALHFDIGLDPGGVYASSTTVANRFVAPAFARGGERIKEIGCNPNDQACLFPAHPGTIGWPQGLQHYLDEVECDNGDEFTTTSTCTTATGRRRFDKVRDGLFHDVVYAHSRGKPKSLPCLDVEG